jgi:Short C-terminal domain
MPGLLRGVARTAVVAGTATAVSNRVSRRQANRWSQQNEPQPQYAQQPQQPQYYEQPPQYAPPAPAPAPVAAPAPDPIEKLKQLAELRDQGILTEEEFAAAKAKVLAS